MRGLHHTATYSSALVVEHCGRSHNSCIYLTHPCSFVYSSTKETIRVDCSFPSVYHHTHTSSFPRLSSCARLILSLQQYHSCLQGGSPSYPALQYSSMSPPGFV